MTQRHSVARRARGLGAGLALTLLGAAADAATPVAPLPAAEVAAFKADPQALLKKYGSAGLPLSTAVKDLVLSDNATASLLMTLAATPGANSAQKGAIGAGLAEAAALLAPTNPKAAADIQTQVAASNDADLVTAYLAASANPRTAAIGGGGGGGGGGFAGGAGGPVGGVGSSAGGGGEGGGTASFGAASPAASFGSAAGVSPPSGGTGVSTTTSTSPASHSL